MLPSIGTRIVKTVPASTSLCEVERTAVRSTTMLRAMDSPVRVPRPTSLVVKNVLEDPVTDFGRDAAAVVGDLDFEHAVAGSRSNADAARALALGVGDGVRSVDDQVQEHLVEADR
ncbi:MAG: hypothetical protein QM756_00880 [Polyangiaceae bacterium]